MINCICCNTDLLKYTGNGNFCPTCNSVFAKNMPTSNELTEYYKNFNEVYHGGGRAKGSNKRQLLYAEEYLRIVNQFSMVGKSIIDIGSSNNPFPNIAHSSGYKVTVVDYIKPKDLNLEINFIGSSIENLITIHLKFEIVTAFAIIEHTRDPLLTINNLIDLCKVNGIIVVYVPEIGQFPDKYSLGTSKWFYPPEHITLLSKKAIVKLFEEKKCILQHYNRFEINSLRYIIRYGIGIIEGTVGYFVKLLAGEILWSKIRQKRKSKYQGMSLFVFKKIE